MIPQWNESGLPDNFEAAVEDALEWLSILYFGGSRLEAKDRHKVRRCCALLKAFANKDKITDDKNED